MIDPADPAGPLLCRRPGCGRPWTAHTAGGPGGGTGQGCPAFLWLDPFAPPPEEDDTPQPGRPS